MCAASIEFTCKISGSLFTKRTSSHDQGPFFPQPITGQVTEINCPELFPRLRQKNAQISWSLEATILDTKCSEVWQVLKSNYSMRPRLLLSKRPLNFRAIDSSLNPYSIMMLMKFADLSHSDRSNCVMWQVKDPCPRPGWDGYLAREKMAFIKSIKTWIILLYIWLHLKNKSEKNKEIKNMNNWI